MDGLACGRPPLNVFTGRQQLAYVAETEPPNRPVEKTRDLGAGNINRPGCNHVSRQFKVTLQVNPSRRNTGCLARIYQSFPA